MNETNKMKCPCCGRTFVEDYDICDECSWQNDPIQFKHPDYAGGANRMSLNEAKKAYRAGIPVV